MAHEVSGEDIDMILVRADIRILCSYGMKAFVPERHGVNDPVGFCGGGEMLVSLAGQVERVAHHAVHSTQSEDGLLDGHLVVGSFIETPTDIRIFPFVVFPDDAEINLTRLPIFQRRLNPFKKVHRPQIDVLPERAPDGYQETPKRDVICNTRMPHSSQESGVQLPKLLKAIGRHHLSVLHVSFATPIELLPVKFKSKTLSCCFEHANAFRNDLFADAISGDDGNVERFHLC